MNDIKIFAFAPKEEPVYASLRDTPDGKAGPASLPYDISINIFQALVDKAADSVDSTMWIVAYDHSVPSKLVVTEDVVTIVKPKKSESQMTRYKHTRVPSQINRKTRAMMSERIPRVPMMDKNGKKQLIDVWIYPEHDRFIPVYSDNRLNNQELFFRQAIILPTPQGQILTQAIQRIFVPTVGYFSETNSDATSSLMTLPNLKEIMVPFGTWFPDFNELVCHRGIRKIDLKLYLTLSKWARSNATAFRAMYDVLEERDIRFYAGLKEGGVPYLEILSTTAGIRARVIDANCTCCEADALY